jgi:hypothetical protein
LSEILTLTRRYAAVVVLLFVACEPATKKATPRKGEEGPRTRATVVEIKTTVLPSKATSTHRVVIANNRVRTTSEAQSWRLFDLAQNRVVRVDDSDRTFRAEPFNVLAEYRRAALAQEVDQRLPRAEYSVTEESRPMLGVVARQHLVTMGKYRRELWIGEHPSIPPQLFALMLASEPSSPLAPVQRAVDEALLGVRGFPLLDHTEVPYGEEKLVAERIVTAVSQQDVPATFLEIPAGYRELPPLPAPPRRPVPVPRIPAPPPPPPLTDTAVTDTTATTATTVTDTTATTATTTTTTTTTTGTTATATTTSP